MQKKQPMLEIAVFNIGSAITAEKAGADRIELCENPADGGTTPSYGTLKIVKEKIRIPVFPIIRPRAGDFLFSAEEFAVMQKDISLCKELGYEGVVIGLLHEDGTVDEARTSALVQIAYPMEVSFHRAFDRAKNPMDSLETLIRCGCERILTSGQTAQAWDGRDLIKALIEKANNRITIMPGSGIRSNNIRELTNYTGAVELHSSARKMVASPMKFTVASMNEMLENVEVDALEIKKMKTALEK
ncbi:MAG: hypothetical protein RLZZ28_457 [Bacteroidota bacterium]|jgi:copper homeostasis protein